MSQNAVSGGDIGGESKKRRRGRGWALTVGRVWMAGVAVVALIAAVLIWCWPHSFGTITINTNMSDIGNQRTQKIHNAAAFDASPRQSKKKGLVFIKSFKTGSTTLATYIAQVGHRKGSYFLHPQQTGWFKDGELLERMNKGQRFDLSIRHVTPNTSYRLMELLVPGASFVTIMRRPLDRFLSLFNFRKRYKIQYKTPQALVSAILKGEVNSNDSRPFCNQLAWLLSGEDIDYTSVRDIEEAKRIADGILATAERWRVTVLLTERMSESIVVLVDLMGWNIEELELRRTSERVQSRGRDGSARGNDRFRVLGGIERPEGLVERDDGHDGQDDESQKILGSRMLTGRSEYYTCQGDDAEACEEAIRKCNMIDELLYTHFEQQFDVLLSQVPNSEAAVAAFEGIPMLSKEKASKLESGTYPTNCIPERKGNRRNKTRREEEEEGEKERYNRLHSCRGHPP